MSKQTKLRYVDETKYTGKTCAPPKRGKAQHTVKAKKLKLEADKAKERTEQLRFGKAEVTVDEASRMAYLLNLCSNNLNQYAKHANESARVYQTDMDDLRTRFEELVTVSKQVLEKLAVL